MALFEWLGFQLERLYGFLIIKILERYEKLRITAAMKNFARE